jgi:hypothetical protein
MANLSDNLTKLRLYAETHKISYVENKLISIGRRPRIGARRDHFLIFKPITGERLVVIYSIEIISHPASPMITTAKIVSTIVDDGTTKIDVATMRGIMASLGFESPSTATIMVDPFNRRALKGVEVCYRRKI